jgi:mevalonate kinase
MKLLEAPGKLLLSAEYMVLHGSKALALPLKMGQSLQRTRSKDPGLFSWRAYQEENPWFSADFNASTLVIEDTTDPVKAEYLRRLIQTCIEMEPLFQKELFTWDVETRLDFSPDWGFGSSSTLMALMAEWAEINPLDLHFSISEGSGYDVACAIAGRPIIYRLSQDGPKYQPLSFYPPFADQLYFVWLGSKQATASHLAEMAGQLSPGFEEVHYFSSLTMSMTEVEELSDFQELMEEHEARLSELIKLERVAESRFPDLQGSVKSLGAWGGDFVMIATEQEPADLYNYLDKLGFATRFRYRDLIHED